jgi:hypothetical protein
MTLVEHAAERPERAVFRRAPIASEPRPMVPGGRFREGSCRGADVYSRSMRPIGASRLVRSREQDAARGFAAADDAFALLFR